MRKLKLFFACLLMAVLSIGQMWGAVVSGTTYETKSASSVPTGWSVTNSYSTGGGGYAKLTYAENSILTDDFCQNGFTSIVIKARKFGSPSNAQAIITVEWCVSGSDDVVLGTVTPSSTSLTNYTINSPASVTANQSGKIRISCKGAGNDKGSGVSEVTITYTAGSCGSVTPICATPTFDPASGEIFSESLDVEIAAESGTTIYYTTNGSTPTTSSSVYSSALHLTETTTLKAIATKTGSNNSAVATATYTKMVTVPGYEIDFESDLAAYTDWTFVNLTKTDETISAHGSSTYFAKTNGTNTASITTKEKVANPGTLTYYISKIGTNTNVNSKWKARVSSNGTDWTIVGTEYAAASGINAGTWYECTADLSAYSNVYVQVYYDGTTAVRTIDDVTLEMASTVAKPTISGDENFVGSTTVTITQADADAIYYTTDGSDPKTSGTKQTYSVPFTVNADGKTTVKAYAVKGSDASAVAEKTFTKVTPMTTAAELRSFATSSAQNAFIQLDGWKVTFVNGNNAYMIDPSNEGVILNNAGHGYVAGDELNDEVVEASVKLASGRVQLSGFTSTDITATSGTVSPVDVTDFSTVLAANQSRLITLKNATYASSTGTFSDGEHLIYFYDQFSANPTLVDGTTYDVTGIVIYYKNNTDDKIEIAPRTAADVKAQTPVVIPTAANLAALKAADRGTYILTLTNAVVTYVNGNNAFIEDATGGALIFFASHGYSAGDCLNGDYQVTTTDYQGKFEITSMEPQAGAAKTTAEIPLTTVSIATLNASFSSYESRRVKIVNANVTDAISGSDRNGAINDGAALTVYAAVASTITLTADDNIDIIGYPGFHNTDQQLNVWKQEDITVNSTPTPPASDYSMSFDLTRASYDAAADAQVVWNSSVVTMTANKNDGTKVTNYLAGNYSGTTLIAETRLYAKNSISFVPQAGVTITKIEWMSTAKGYATKLAAETFVNATAVVDGTDDKLVIITPSAAGEISVTLTDAARATAVTVYYEAESEKAKLTASISIANINTAVGEDDILLSDIAATSNPNKKAISYAITSGSEYVSITGEGPAAAFHALAEGTATITATIPDNLGNYTGATTTFDIIVAAAPVPATLLSIAISGTASVLEYTEGQDFNPAGLVVTGHYSDGPDAEITEGITWSFDPSPLTVGTTSVSVTATVSEITSAAFPVSGLTVSAPAPAGDNYVKVTASQTDWSGDYLLVFEDGNDAYVWNGDYNDGASNYASATISSNTIAKPATAAVITIAAASEGKYTLQVNGDKYFQDNGSGSKLIFTDAIEDAAEVTISYETDWTKLMFSERCIRFNSGSGQTRFRFYAATNQQAVQLYKKESSTPVYTKVRSGLVAGRHYTVCLEKNVTAVKGATFWSLTYKNEGGTIAYLEEETAPFAEGKPYIIQATDDNEGKLEVLYGTETAVSPVANGVLRGTFSYLSASQLNTINDEGENDVYMLFNNELRPIGTNNHLDAHRAYVLYNLLQKVPAAGFAPGKRVKGMPMQPQVTTDIDNVQGDNVQCTKVLIDGQMYILRGEKLYDATGRLVK